MIKTYKQICNICGAWFEVDVDTEDKKDVVTVCDCCSNGSSRIDDIYDEQYWWEYDNE